MGETETELAALVLLFHARFGGVLGGRRIIEGAPRRSSRRGAVSRVQRRRRGYVEEAESESDLCERWSDGNERSRFDGYLQGGFRREWR